MAFCVVVVETSFFSLLPAVCEEARAQTVGRGTELPLPHAAQRDSIANKQGKRALGGDSKVYLSHVIIQLCGQLLRIVGV